MNNHRITVRAQGKPASAMIVHVIKENEITSSTGLPLYESVQRMADETFDWFCREADYLAREAGEHTLVEYEMIDTQSPVGTSTHIRSVRNYAA